MSIDGQSLSILVHGPSKAGKTTLADTAPGPRLILDAEGGSRFTGSAKTYWDPLQGPPPARNGWETCVVIVRDYQTMERAFTYLETGQHEFKSVIVDSISEVQQRCVDAMVGLSQMRTQDWGELLRKMSKLVRDFRDLTVHPTNPLQTVVLIAMTKSTDEKKIPYVQGQLATTLPYYLDMIGYLFVEDDGTGNMLHKMLITSHPDYEAGDRTGLGKTQPIILNPRVDQILHDVYAQFGVPPAPVAADPPVIHPQPSEPSYYDPNNNWPVFLDPETGEATYTDPATGQCPGQEAADAAAAAAAT